MESYTIKTTLLLAHYIETVLMKLMYVFSKEFQVAKLVKQANIGKAVKYLKNTLIATLTS